MNRADQLSAYQATGVSATSSALSTSTASNSAASTTNASTTSIPSASAAAQAEHKPPIAAIAGGAAGGAFALAVIIGLVIYYVCFVKKSKKGLTGTVERRQSMPGNGMDETAHMSRMKAPDGKAYTC
jgi:uncharacterized protein HemX